MSDTKRNPIKWLSLFGNIARQSKERERRSESIRSNNALDFDPQRYAGTTGDREDHAPGDEPEESAGHWISNSNLGLGFSVLLTAAAFWAAGTHLIWGPAVPVALIVLAIAQMGVHLVFFLHVTTGPDNTNNVLALAFGILVVFLIVAGSLWIMSNLQHNMMPMDANQMNQMQPQM